VRGMRLTTAKQTKASNGTPKTTPRSAKARRNPDGTQQRILEAAVREFSDHGYAGARIERIAKRADTGDRMLYYYFGNKEQLFRTVLEHTYESLVSAQQALHLKELDPLSGLKQLIAFTWNYYIDHPELIRLFNNENLHFGRHVKQSAKIKKLAMPVINILRELTQRGAKAGVFRNNVDPVRLYITMASLGYFYLSNRYTLSRFLGIDLMDEKRRAQWLDHITGIVVSHLQR
jgi:TetR/AcrR family transcriptional regulator, upper aerobic nicotinate degradation pathway regulator